MVKPAPIWTTGAPPEAGDPTALDVRWERWSNAAGPEADDALRAFVGDARDEPAARALLEAAFGHSPFLTNCLIADPPFVRRLIEDGPDRAFAEARDAARDSGGLGAESTPDVMKRLRHAKRRAALAIGMADIASVWPLEKLTAALSEFAGAALGASCRHLLRTLHDKSDLALPAPETPERGSGLIVLGMGKLGADELNYSSDVDVIVLYDENVAPATNANRTGRMFAQLVRDLISIMQQRTADGYVFRTDIRLRPDPGSTPPALSVAAALKYYETVGRTWERAAMIKARPVAGDAAAGEAFLDSLRPFVWRRHLDFATIQDIGSVKRQINAERGGDSAAIEGRDVKLGRGGIREIEFFAQTQQLVWGGRSPDLRGRRTLETLDALVAARHLAPADATDLKSAYAFHRRVEHRVQMVDDQQTHSLPRGEEEMARLAVFLGFDSAAEFSERFLAHARAVERSYGTLFEDRPGRAAPVELMLDGGETGAASIEAVEKLGYADGARILAIVDSWRTGERQATKEARARELLTDLGPTVLAAFAAAPNPDAALARFDEFLAHLPDGVRTFSLLAARPELIGLVAEIMSGAPRLADSLTRHPVLFESVLGREFTDIELSDDLGLDAETADTARRGLVRLYYTREFDIDDLRAELAAATRDARDGRELLDAHRRWTNDKTFRIGIHMLRGFLTPLEASRPLSDIADACLGVLFSAVADDFAAAHGRVPGGRTALAAFGDLGGREMNAASDLDPILFFDHDPDARRSDGPEPLVPESYYAELYERFARAITEVTAEGRLYGMDADRRASGHVGPAVCPMARLADRRDGDAGVQERRALIRARVVHAEGGLDDAFEAARRSILARPLAEAGIAAGIAKMRATAPKGGTFDDAFSVTHAPGGLVDTELAALYLRLSHAEEAPEILAGDAVSVFEAARAHEWIDPETAIEFADAARLWRNLAGILSLTVADAAIPDDRLPEVRNVIARSCGAPILESFDQTVRETASWTARRFDAMLEGRISSPAG